MKTTFKLMLVSTFLLNAVPSFATETETNQKISKIQELLEVRQKEQALELESIKDLKKQIKVAEDKIKHNGAGAVLFTGMIYLSYKAYKGASGDSFARWMSEVQSGLFAVVGGVGASMTIYKLKVAIDDLPELKEALRLKEKEANDKNQKLKEAIEALKDN